MIINVGLCATTLRNRIIDRAAAWSQSHYNAATYRPVVRRLRKILAQPQIEKYTGTNAHRQDNRSEPNIEYNAKGYVATTVPMFFVANTIIARNASRQRNVKSRAITPAKLADRYNIKLSIITLHRRINITYAQPLHNDYTVDMCRKWCVWDQGFDFTLTTLGIDNFSRCQTKTTQCQMPRKSAAPQAQSAHCRKTYLPSDISSVAIAPPS